MVTDQWRALFFSKRSTSPIFLYLLILLPFILYKYWQFLAASAEQMIERTGDNPLTELFFINLAAWLLPAWSSQPIGVRLKRNRFFPFRERSLFFIRTLALLTTPVSILAFVFSGLSFYPIFRAADPPAAALCAAGLLLFAVWTSFTFVNLLNLRGGRPIIFGIAALTIVGTTFFGPLTGLTPATLHAAPGSILFDVLFNNSLIFNFVLVTAVTAIGAAASFLSLKGFLEEETGPPRNSKNEAIEPADPFYGRPAFSTKAGLLVKKDLGNIFRLSLAPYVSLLITIYYAYFLSVSNENGHRSSSGFLIYIFIPHALMFFNFFGLDPLPAIERYASLAIDPAETIRIKNLSSLAAAGVSLVIILPVMLFKFGPVIALGLAVKWCLLTAGYLSVGNFLSVIFSFKRRDKGAFPAGLFSGYAGAVLILSFMLVLTDSLGRENVVRSMWIGCLVLLVYTIVYFISLLWAKKNLRRYWESIRSSAS